MSKLDELITELCPDEVEYIELNKVIDYEQPTKYIVKSTKYDDSYTIPVLTAGQSFVLGYTNEDFGIYKATPNNPVIIFDDFTASFHWVDFNFKVKSSAMKMLKPRNEEIVNFRFLFYTMKKIKYVPVDHTRQWIEKYSEFKIPFPPLPVQQEIVRILDNFTELTEELTEELTARRKQYEYYRDLLLTFDDNPDVKWLKLGEFAECYAGATPQTKKKEYWDNGTIPWMSSGEVNFGQIYDTEKKISQLGYDNCSTKMVPKNTVVVALAGQGKTRGMVAITRIPLCTNQSLCSIVSNEQVSSDFLYYYLKTQYQKLRLISSGDGTRGGLNLKMIKNYLIPIPSTEEQQRIVAILDRFDALCNDLTSGIPAEIEARQKQYEYYRDKLLTFKEVSA